MILFFALLFVAVAIAGFCAFVIFWPLSLVHIRDRHPQLQAQLGEGAFARPSAWGWLLRRGYLARERPQSQWPGQPGADLAADDHRRPRLRRPALAACDGDRMNDNDQWWLATIGRTVIWARLRMLEAGTAEVLDSDGVTPALRQRRHRPRGADGCGVRRPRRPR